MSGHVLTVSDANVLIDIEAGGLTSSMFSLPNTSFCVPDVLFEQELRKNHSHLQELGLGLCSLAGDSVAQVYGLAQRHGKVSRLDLFALQLAREKSALLLTGDRALRNVAARYQVECHGTIWLVERMIKLQVLQPAVASSAYMRMQAAGSRLPWKEVESRLKRMVDELPPSGQATDVNEPSAECLVRNI